ncbi:MAG: hypothetical protein IJE43_05845, partial [Alphaproteobacteria bacterium]|nr:hypothetical protein [Alphaproteobacteria bacterium]
FKGLMQRVNCNSGLNSGKAFGAFRRCPVSRAYSPQAEPPVLRVAAICLKENDSSVDRKVLL